MELEGEHGGECDEEHDEEHDGKHGRVARNPAKMLYSKLQNPKNLSQI